MYITVEANFMYLPVLHMHPMMNINGIKKSPFCSSLCLELQVQTRGQHTIKKNANMWLILAACYIHLQFSEYIIQRTFKYVNQIINLNCHGALRLETITMNMIESRSFLIYTLSHVNHPSSIRTA